MGVALGVNYGVGQSRAEGYDAEAKTLGLPNVSGALLVRRSLADWSGLRAGVRGGYVQDMVLLDFDSNNIRNKGQANEVSFEGQQGAILAANAFLAGTVGGEIFLGGPEKARPYLLGELGGSVMHQHPLAKAGVNNDATCGISPYCAPDDQADTADAKPKESRRITGGPLLAVGFGVALPDPAIRIELSYLHAVTMGSEWSNPDDYIKPGEVTSPNSSVGIVELSVGYAFGGG